MSELSRVLIRHGGPPQTDGLLHRVGVKRFGLKLDLVRQEVNPTPRRVPLQRSRTRRPTPSPSDPHSPLPAVFLPG